MPFIHVTTTERLADGNRAPLLQSLSRLLAEGIGKPEAYVMVAVQGGVDMMHSGKPGPVAFVDVRSIGGLTPRVCQGLSERLCTELNERIGVPKDRIFLNFTDVPAGRWGHQGGTFG